MKEKQYDGIINGVKPKHFPSVPVDYGYRDSTNFWYTKFTRPIPEKIQAKDGDVNSVIYCAERIDPDIKFTKEACEKLVKIPRVFLKLALKQMVDIAREEGFTTIGPSELEVINDKRRKDKK